MEHYEFITMLGEGTYATVFHAKDTRNGRDVAIKVFKEPFESWEAANSVPEVRYQARVGHPNVLRVLEATMIEKTLYLVSEFCSQNLFEALSLVSSSARRIPEEEVRWLMRRILGGLAATHGQGMVHRDVKPENVLLAVSGGESGRPVLCDFGQASLLARSSLTPYVATRWYRSPEQLLGSRRYGAGVDIWAAGMLMGELLTSRPLAAGTSEADQLRRISVLLGDPHREWPEVDALARAQGIELPSAGAVNTLASALGSRVSSDACAAVQAMLQWNPARRPSANEALRLRFFTAGPESPFRPPPTPPRAAADAAARLSARDAQTRLRETIARAAEKDRQESSASSSSSSPKHTNPKPSEPTSDFSDDSSDFENEDKPTKKIPIAKSPKKLPPAKKSPSPPPKKAIPPPEPAPTKPKSSKPPSPDFSSSEEDEDDLKAPKAPSWLQSSALPPPTTSSYTTSSKPAPSTSSYTPSWG